MPPSSDLSPRDPVTVLISASGNRLRLLALGLGVVAPFLPALNMTAFEDTISRSLVEAVPWAVGLPIIIALTLLLTTIPTAARYARLCNVVAAAAGIGVSIYVLYAIIHAQADAASIGGAMIGGNAGSGANVSASLGLGAYLVFAATAVLVFQSIRDR